jgi:hypothetical protein
MEREERDTLLPTLVKYRGRRMEKERNYSGEVLLSTFVNWL